MGGAAQRDRIPSPTHCGVEGLGGAGQSSLRPAPTGPAPAFRTSSSPLRRALNHSPARAANFGATSGYGGTPGPDHIVAAPPDSPRGPEAPARLFLRPGHGRPRRPLVRSATRGTRGRATRGERVAGGRRAPPDRALDADDSCVVRGAP